MGSGFRVVLMDLMGCGLSDTAFYSPQAYDSLDAHAEDVLQVVSALQNGGPTVLIGHSVGAAICLAAGMRPASCCHINCLQP
jgi:sigma-B regulation protein RsbQ